MVWNFQSENKNMAGLEGQAGFMRLLLLRNIWQGFEKSADIQGGPVF
jgi:hypothetical protein